MLMAFFQHNAQNGPDIPKYLYIRYPEYFVWQKREHIWTLRKKKFAIGHIHFASPSSGECFYLYTLLTVVPGPTSFENLQTVEGVLHPTFQAECLARGLLEDYSE